MSTTTAPLDRPNPRGDGAEEALDLVFIEGFEGSTVIGIHESELHLPQTILIDVCAGLARARACETDRIGDAGDYGELRTRLRRLMAQHGVQLLEALAEQVAHIVLLEFGALWVRVRIAKPRKFDDTQAVGVMIERRRETLPGTATRATSLRLIGAGLVPGSRLGGDE
ncbi:MAG: dihydroneopterin aldolase [Betaproteobacteria bacterium]